MNHSSIDEVSIPVGTEIIMSIAKYCMRLMQKKFNVVVLVLTCARVLHLIRMLFNVHFLM